MKKFSILILGLSVLVACTHKAPEDTILHFEVENMTASQVAVLLDRTTNYVVDLDKDGKGELIFSGDGIKGDIYPNLAYGQEMAPIFVGKGEEVTIRFSADHFPNGIKVDGQNEEAVQYLQSVIYPEINEYQQTFPAFKQCVEDAQESVLEFMQERQLEENCPEFAAIEKERLTYLFAQSYIMYPMGYAMTHQIENYHPEEDWYETIARLVVERPELADIDAYRAFIQFAIPIVLEKDGLSFSNSYERTLATIGYIVDHWENHPLKENLIRMLAIDQIQNSGVLGTEDLQKLVRAYVTNPSYLKDIQDAFEENDPAAKGKLSPDFLATDLDGKEFSLADFLGKYIYVDLWATWCGPCRNELPHLKSLEKKFEGKNILFIGLNLDEEQATWKNFLEKEDLPGTQLWLGKDSDFLKAYNVRGIPRFILLDKEGRILNPNMLRPSSKDTETLISQLEGI